METKKILVSVIFLFAFLLSLSLVMGAVSVISPTDGSNITSAVFNCTYTNVTDMTNPTADNSSFYQDGVAIPCTISISSVAVYCTPTASQLTDGLNQNIGCKVGNATQPANWSTTNTTGVDIYTSTPVCSSFELDRPNIGWMDLLGVNPEPTTTKDALSSLTYLWEIWDSDGNSVTTSTSSAPNFANADFSTKGEYTIGLTITDDWINRNSCENKTIFVSDSDGDALAVAGTVTETTTDHTALWVILIISVLAIIIVTAFIIISQTKKR